MCVDLQICVGLGKKKNTEYHFLFPFYLYMLILFFFFLLQVYAENWGENKQQSINTEARPVPK